MRILVRANISADYNLMQLALLSANSSSSISSIEGKIAEDHTHTYTSSHTLPHTHSLIHTLTHTYIRKSALGHTLQRDKQKNVLTGNALEDEKIEVELKTIFFKSIQLKFCRKFDQF